MLSAGEKLGPYEIVALIGKGGMGEVYRARDPRLGRDVAIKISAERFSERFEREARAIASLNHPNICTLHDIGPNYLVMELVEGESPQGPLPFETALNYARQIAAALEEAHSKGVIHRDLKPGNIKVKPDGTIKVLDFGLAKVAPASSGESRSEDSPTMSMAATQAGMILGTAAYMAPEQARGKVVDKRADIWAFGVVFYEMLSGERLFRGDDISEILAGVIKEKPDLSEVPPQVRPLLERCLEKDPAKRLRDIGDMELLLHETPLRAGRARPLPWVAAAVFAVFAVVVLWAPWRKTPAPADLVKFEIFAPEKTTMQKFAVSPDGRKIAFYASEAGGRGGLWVRSLDSIEARRIAETEVGPPLFIWSPDSQFIAFPDGKQLNKLIKVDISGGSPQTVSEIKTTIAGGSWNRDGTIIFGSLSGVWRVSAAGGEAVPLTAMDPLRQEQSHFAPLFLPDGKHFVYLRRSRVADNSGIYLGSLDSQPEQQGLKKLAATNYSPVFAPSPDSNMGYLLFLREDALMAQSLDLVTLEMTGEPVRIADHIGAAFEFGYFGASANGVLAYRSGNVGGLAYGQLSWFDRQGNNLGLAVAPGMYLSHTLSADGTRVAFTRLDVANEDIALFEFARNTFTRLTSDPAPDTSPVWSADGTRVAYASARQSGVALYQKTAGGGGEEETLLAGSGVPRELDDWSRDGRFLLYAEVNPKTKSDLWVLPMPPEKANEARKPGVYVASEFNESQGRFSPDGHWIAYVSDESGKAEVYIQPFPPTAGAGKLTISNGGGSMPRWRRDGKELFYLGGNSRTLMAADVTYMPSLKIGVSKPVFETPFPQLSGWDVTADGKKFLLSMPAALQNTPQPPLTVVLNWTALLKK
jgi:Tol biopolymer transport system component